MSATPRRPGGAGSAATKNLTRLVLLLLLLLPPLSSLPLGAAEQPNLALGVLGVDGLKANATGTMTEEQKREFMKKFEADLVSPAEVALWKRGASNAGYHYLGCAKTFGLMGKAFAEASLKLLASQRP